MHPAKLPSAAENLPINPTIRNVKTLSELVFNLAQQLEAVGRTADQAMDEARRKRA